MYYKIIFYDQTINQRYETSTVIIIIKQKTEHNNQTNNKQISIEKKSNQNSKKDRNTICHSDT